MEAYLPRLTIRRHQLGGSLVWGTRWGRANLQVSTNTDRARNCGPYKAVVPFSYFSSNMSESEFKTLGFVGLGAMGRPMLVHLANKLPAESRIYVFDVVEQAINEVCSQYPGRVLRASSAKDVAQQAVSYICQSNE